MFYHIFFSEGLLRGATYASVSPAEAHMDQLIQ